MLKTHDLEGLQEPVCVLMPSVGVLTCEHMNSLQVPDPQAMSINTVVFLLLATQENSQPCVRVHLFAMGVLYTTAQSMNERGKKNARNVDPALRTWLWDDVMCERFRNTTWTSRGLAVDWARTTVHDIDEEGMSSYFCTISQYRSSALHSNVAFDTSCLGGQDTTIFACWWIEHGRAAWLIPMVPCCDVAAKHTQPH